MATTTRPVAVHAVPHAQAHAQQVAPRPNIYGATAHELRAGPRNPLFLMLRSGIDSEVDYALPRLVLASFEYSDKFLLEHYIDSVSALREWPERWLDELEREHAYYELLRAGRNGDELARKALGAVPAFTANPVVEARASYSLQVLRNSSFVGQNARTISRTSFINFVTRFFDLSPPFLLEIVARSPEPVQHILILLQQISPYLYVGPPIYKLLSEVLPYVATNTRDSTVLQLVIPILITAFQVPTFPPPPDSFIQHMLHLLTLNPPPSLLSMVLDLLAAVAPQAPYARTILSDPSISAHLRQLTILLKHQAKTHEMALEVPPEVRSKNIYNPAAAAHLSRQAAMKRQRQREIDQPQMEVFGGPGVQREVGTVAPTLNPSIRKELYTLSEPKRSIAWMHETFVYSSQAQLLQVSFWHAYRDFFSNPATVEQLLSASEVIKNVQVAFPAAQAKLFTEKDGERKFIISGLGFRQGSDGADRFGCVWRGCTSPTGPSNPGELLAHIQSAHLDPMPPACAWGSCQHAGVTVGHVLTHLPLLEPLDVPQTIAVDARTPTNVLYSPVITDKLSVQLPHTEHIKIQACVTPHDQHRQPSGAAFLAALVIRGLARNLATEIAAARPGEVGLTDAQRKEKKRHLAEERFGLPIPDAVLREEEEEEDAARGGDDYGAGASMGLAEIERARRAFHAVQDALLDVVNNNVTGIGAYISDAFVV
ncbi:hypothetical protein CC85DRAFT_282658 [Cutaneotrichosporon oleaginosum]|uniref:RFX-type winged-helix domain-containing protein n=1 Tax=Cutaneotrichosporon oleaginosum TaxID=879819 RepID=A0A0J1BB32_9TREE|nr:uncharacterized protein CC85DRAFT_282658 [Cutaneotrichosporon oleaginosum]KLT45164.1 hypothetical protein CC85DRAFT_282658 [Cutaneotrichosporon oleaginosum]TXT14998.1 hypothetical protein COLE_01191 [Cutaneotrichosporon oleaginosum]